MPFVDVIRQKTTTVDAKNLLFLGDGFAATDRALFDGAVTQIVDELFKIKPFDLPGVAEKINIFSAFEPSSSSGISCSVPVIESGASIGMMDPSGTATLADKPSRFGLAYTGGVFIEPKPGAELITLEFIASLLHPFEASTATAIPDCWDLGGKDAGFVVMLVNDDVGAGTILEHDPGGSSPSIPYAAVVPVGVREDVGFNVIFDFSLPAHVFDHTPLIGSGPGHLIAIRILTDTIAHELGHSAFYLEDEYVSEPFDPAAGTVSYAGPPAVLKDVPNITSNKDAQDAAGKYTKVKWKDDMVAMVRTYVEATGPLRRDSQCGTYTTGQVVDDSEVYPPSPAAFRKLIKLPSRIIGLYEGGARQPCGVFRPTGACKMRNTSFRESPPPGGNLGAYVSAGFCYVCKKAIIMAIDPTLEPALHARDYPRL